MILPLVNGLVLIQIAIIADRFVPPRLPFAYASLGVMLGLYAGIVISFRAAVGLYDVWTCRGDKWREYQARYHTSGYVPWWGGVVSWLVGMGLLFVFVWYSAMAWRWFEQYAARH